MTQKELISAILAEVILSNQERDLPDYLVARVQEVLNQSTRHALSLPLLQELRECINEFDTYAQSGYLGRGYSAGNIEALLHQLASELP